MTRTTTSTTPSRWTRGLAAAAGTALALGLAVAPGTASAAPGGNSAGQKVGSGPECAGRSVPASKISIQMFSLIPWVSEVGLETVLAELSAMGFKNIEPFGGTYGGRTAEEFAALLKEYGLKASSSHGSQDEATFDATIDYAKTIGQHYIGAGGPPQPRFGTYEDTLTTAEVLNRLGERAHKAGLHKILVHNHQSEFTTQHVDPATGETKSAWQILVENTDPRYVTFQLDVLWAADAGVDVVSLIEEYGDRIELLHIKDGFLNGDARASFANVGQGEIDWAPILQAAQGQVKYYVLEYDRAPDGEDFARESFAYLRCLAY